MDLPHSLKRIRLQLARSKQFPSGSTHHGYEFVAPIDDSGHIDPRLWHQYKEHCRVRRFWQGEDEQIGDSSTSQVAPSTPAGYLTMTPAAMTTTRAATVSARTGSLRESTCRSATRTATCIPFRSHRCNRRRETCNDGVERALARRRWLRQRRHASATGSSGLRRAACRHRRVGGSAAHFRVGPQSIN